MASPPAALGSGHRIPCTRPTFVTNDSSSAAVARESIGDRTRNPDQGSGAEAGAGARPTLGIPPLLPDKGAAVPVDPAGDTRSSSAPSGDFGRRGRFGGPRHMR
ncbi:hypothetical protein E4U42_005949 [Claviceps africana]|uniref:Uncharacterized protein n=1 Tax=Claviceps africana TaxID=83212 RepID=A0A8K0NJN1_9HYPO|nr:hypothetical protein E4U42_005949 [Claviceps africana]